jgi:hypothetical protein
MLDHSPVNKNPALQRCSAATTRYLIVEDELRACVASDDVAAAIASDEKVQLRNILMNPTWNSWCRREGL